MIDKNTIKTQVLSIIERYAFNKELIKNAQDNSRIINDLKINSARMVDIILDVEEKFNISIEDDLLEKLITIKDVVEMITVKIK